MGYGSVVFLVFKKNFKRTPGGGLTQAKRWSKGTLSPEQQATSDGFGPFRVFRGIVCVYSRELAVERPARRPGMALGCHLLAARLSWMCTRLVECAFHPGFRGASQYLHVEAALREA